MLAQQIWQHLSVFIMCKLFASCANSSHHVHLLVSCANCLHHVRTVCIMCICLHHVQTVCIMSCICLPHVHPFAGLLQDEAEAVRAAAYEELYRAEDEVRFW